MSNLYFGNKIEEVGSVFQLLGERENDMSFSLAWALSRCPKFLTKFLSGINQRNIELSQVKIHLQKSGGKKEGITDIELKSPKFDIIIEAKRGWNRPSNAQLNKYVRKLRKSKKQTRLIVLSEYGRENSENWLPRKIKRVIVQPISWREAMGFARQALPHSSHAQKRLIMDLIVYFNKIMTKQKYDSNEVYVVALNTNNKVENWKCSPADPVIKSRRYFHPIRVGWPKDPPNYIAFRYNGKLQSIHHIHNYTVTRNLKEWLIKKPKEDHYLYTLGPAIKPSKEIRSGKIYPNGRVWCMLDALLTSKTIFEARNISKKRKLKAENS